MNLVFALAIYFVCWWIILFAILPFGVTTQHEAGEVSPGTVESAPVAPKLIPKLIATTIASTIELGWLATSRTGPPAGAAPSDVNR